MSFLEKNLAALQAIDAAVAAAIAQALVPGGFERRTGTDGTPTFVRIEADAEGLKRLAWLRIPPCREPSAEPLVSGLDAGPGGSGCNGLGLAIGTGYEWAAFAARSGAGTGGIRL